MRIACYYSNHRLVLTRQYTHPLKPGKVTIPFHCKDIPKGTESSILKDSLAMAIDCLAGYLYNANLEGENVPPASSLKTIDPQKIISQHLSGRILPFLPGLMMLP